MNPTDPDLYARLLAFPVDDGEPDLPFEARLARENGWPARYACRVVLEYRRFLYLAMTAGHVVCPSEEVDQAWHLHLTYTRSYWDRLCKELLGRPLHHNPTRGGAAEAALFRDLYQKTLASYRSAFGEEPPADVWPPADDRFGDDLRVARVNTARNWVVPKAAARRLGAAVALAGVVALCGTGCRAELGDPFDLPGKAFLGVLIPALLGAFALGLVLRNRLRWPGPQPGDDTPDLHWADAAYLIGGKHRLAAATMARLVESGVARVSADGTALEPVADHPLDLSPVEEAVYRSLPVGRHRRDDLATVARSAEHAFADRADRLRDAGYLLSADRRFATGLAAVVPVVAVVLFLGLPRLETGLERGKPSGLLIATLVVTAVASLILFARSLSRLSRRGEYVVDRLRTRTLVRLAGPSESVEPVMTVAVCGPATLGDSGSPELAALAGWFPRKNAGHHDSGCGTNVGCGGGGGAGDGGGDCGGGAGAGCGGGGGGGGGGCGGGGCGGGGCGGCGGS